MCWTVPFPIHALPWPPKALLSSRGTCIFFAILLGWLQPVQIAVVPQVTAAGDGIPRLMEAALQEAVAAERAEDAAALCGAVEGMATILGALPPVVHFQQLKVICQERRGKRQDSMTEEEMG